MTTTTATTRHPAQPAPDPEPPRPPWYSRTRLGQWIESARVQHVIIAVIVLNAATLGLETSDAVMARYADLLHAIDHVCLAIFVAELAVKLYAFRAAFFKNSWNVFDLVVVGIALVPGSGAFGVLRSLRVLRVLRLISMVPQLRRVVEALVKAVPGILSIGALLTLLFYVCAVMSTMLFGDALPEEFGSLSTSLFTLFQIMTLDGWSDLVREVLPVHPWAPAFFIPYILLSAFTVLNLFIAVIVDAMQHLREDEMETAEDEIRAGGAEAPADAAVDVVVPQLASAHSVHEEIHALRAQVAELTELVRSRS